MLYFGPFLNVLIICLYLHTILIINFADLKDDTIDSIFFTTVCPLVFPDTKSVAKECGNVIKNHTACCHSMSNYVSHLQKQSFITNLQALDCAALLGLQLQKMNVSTNIYTFCHITLKDFSLQG